MIRQVGSSSLFAFFLVCVSLVLHLVEPGLITYKGDEAYMLESVTETRGLSAFPALGMPSGAAGLANPGLSVWVFSAPAKLLGLTSPEPLSRFVGMTYILSAFALLVWVFASRSLSSADRSAWIWGVGLSAVNPVLLLFTRKIWAQSLLPVFSAAIFILWVEKKRHPALRVALAFLCVLIGQVHMSGFFLGGALLAAELRDVILKRSTFAPLFVGAAAGALPLIPWLSEIVSTEGRTRLGHAVGSSTGDIPEFLKFRYWSYMLSFDHGLSLKTSLGAHFNKFAVNPSVLVALIATLVLLSTAISRGARKLRRPSFKRFDSWTSTSQLLFLGLVVCGILMTLTGVRIHRHYLIVLTPLIGVGLARLSLDLFPRKAWGLLAAYAVLQILLSVETLRFLDKNRGAPDADFGVPYKYQVKPPKERLS